MNQVGGVAVRHHWRSTQVGQKTGETDETDASIKPGEPDSLGQTYRSLTFNREVLHHFKTSHFSY